MAVSSGIPLGSCQHLANFKANFKGEADGKTSPAAAFYAGLLRSLVMPATPKTRTTRAIVRPFIAAGVLSLSILGVGVSLLWPGAELGQRLRPVAHLPTFHPLRLLPPLPAALCQPRKGTRPLSGVRLRQCLLLCLPGLCLRPRVRRRSRKVPKSRGQERRLASQRASLLVEAHDGRGRTRSKAPLPLIQVLDLVDFTAATSQA